MSQDNQGPFTRKEMGEQLDRMMDYLKSTLSNKTQTGRFTKKKTPPIGHKIIPLPGVDGFAYIPQAKEIYVVQGDICGPSADTAEEAIELWNAMVAQIYLAVRQDIIDRADQVRGKQCWRK